jgi:hypothetical protein
MQVFIIYLYIFLLVIRYYSFFIHYLFGFGPQIANQGKDSGVLVTKLLYNNSAYGHLQEGDVILEIDGVKIFNNGTVSLRLNPTSKHKYRQACLSC